MSESVDTLMRDLEQELGVRGPAAVLRAALKIAKEAAAEAKQSEPPALPAWMFEVAREANAAGYDAANAATAAAAARAGERDHDLGAATAIRALRLALERGHVEQREGGSSLSLIAMKGPMHRAWRAGFRSARSEARALLDSIQLDDKAEANCTRHVNDILRTLPTRGA